MPGKPIFSEISWKGNRILLVGSVHGAHTYFKNIVNRLEEFNPEVVLVEGNSLSGKGVESRSGRAYKQINTSTELKALNTVPLWITRDPNTSPLNYETVSEEDFKYGPFDARTMGRKGKRIFRWLTKYADRDLWDTAVEGREDEMVEKIIDQIETHGHSRVAVIFGDCHVFGIEKIFDRL